LHQTATHCTSLHQTATHYTSLHQTATHYTSLHQTATHYTLLHQTATHYTSSHQTATHYTVVVLLLSATWKSIILSLLWRSHRNLFFDKKERNSATRVFSITRNEDQTHSWLLNNEVTFIQKKNKAWLDGCGITPMMEGGRMIRRTIITHARPYIWNYPVNYASVSDTPQVANIFTDPQRIHT